MKSVRSSGNFSRHWRDRMSVFCEDFREAASARLDGEASPMSDDHLDEHLAQCARCRAWQHEAATLSRTLRVRPVLASPELTERVLDALPQRSPLRWRRILLGVVGACQLLLGLLQVAGSGHGHSGEMAHHLFNESTAWNLSLGLGLMWAAWRTGTASGLVPVLSAFLIVLTGFSIHDLTQGWATTERIATHGLLVLGLIALVLVHRARSHPRPGTPLGGADNPTATPISGDDVITEVSDDHYLGPTARRRAG